MNSNKSASFLFHSTAFKFACTTNSAVDIAECPGCAGVLSEADGLLHTHVQVHCKTSCRFWATAQTRVDIVVRSGLMRLSSGPVLF